VGGALRLVFAAPPQHGKTEITLHGLAWLVKQNPGKRFAYVTYNQKRADSVSRRMRHIFAAAGIVATGTLSQMVLPGGTTILFTSIDGGITGEPVDGCVIIDDPFKGRQEADSARRREIVEESYRAAIVTRVHPGASILVLATRWHPDDLSGMLVKQGWEYINLPAIAENDNAFTKDDPHWRDINGRLAGEALFPEMWPLEELAKKRADVGDFTWAALYQGRPRPKGGKVFHEPTFYTKLPESYRGIFGIDLAYSAKTSADWSICLELWREEAPLDSKGKPIGLPTFYVVNVYRAQCEAPEFAVTLRGAHLGKPTFKMHWRASGTEKGSADFLKRQKIPIHVTPPPGDKLVSSQHAAPAWNQGRIRVPDPSVFPDCERWLYAFLDIVANFTGLGKEHDDDVDALSTAFDKLQTIDSGFQPPPTTLGGVEDRPIGI
jgi:phage terminase large subunit-like protein